MGEYWDRAIQVDVVGLRSDGWIELGECKWSDRASLASTTRDLLGAAARYPSAGRTVRPHLFVHRAPRTSPDAVEVHDVDDLYGDRRRPRRRI